MGLEVTKYFHLGGFKGVHFKLHIHEMLHKKRLIVEKCSLRSHHGYLLVLYCQDLSKERIIKNIREVSWRWSS